ncbi:MAG TPA: PucR family transcriptional regulator ligand-binding domain-containing protein [Paenibacillus sp.]|jgi:purine catabolism regulator
MNNEPLTVNRLLQMPLFQGAKVIGGAEGLSNEIYYVDSMEMPDLTGWLRPNELILTTGYSIRLDPSMLGRLLDEMHRVGGAAIGIKSKRFLQEVPQEVISKSNLYGIPLFDIPLDITFMDMTQVIMDYILNRQAYMLQEVQELNQQFINLILNRRMNELVVLIGQLLQCEVAVLNVDREIESCSIAFQITDVVEERSVRVGSRMLGYVAITRPLAEQDRFEQMCLNHVVTVLAIEFKMRQSQQLHREREQELFLVELLSGSDRQEELLRYRAKQLGIFYSKFQYVIVIKVSHNEQTSNEQTRLLNDWLLRTIHKHKPFGRKAVEVNERILVLCASQHHDIESQKAETEQWLQDLLQEAAERTEGMTLLCGIGGIREQLTELSYSYQEAQKAIFIGVQSLPQQTIIHIQDILVENLLLEIGEHPLMEVLCEELITPLYRYDMANRTELLSTLEVFLRAGGNTKKVSEQLFIHRNSVLYRLERIGEIMHKDLNEAEVRFRLDLAIRYWKMKSVVGKNGL